MRRRRRPLSAAIRWPWPRRPDVSGDRALAAWRELRRNVAALVAYHEGRGPARTAFGARLWISGRRSGSIHVTEAAEAIRFDALGLQAYIEASGLMRARGRGNMAKKGGPKGGVTPIDGARKKRGAKPAEPKQGMLNSTPATRAAQAAVEAYDEMKAAQEKAALALGEAKLLMSEERLDEVVCGDAVVKLKHSDRISIRRHKSKQKARAAAE